MEKIIFLSPHLDDAVFSCAGLIQKLIRDQREVEIITIFAQGNEQRKAEDRKAALILECRVRHLNFLDAPQRRQNSEVLFQDLTKEMDTIDQLVLKLKELNAESTSEVKFYSPLGIGWHIDHLITFHAALMALPRENLSFYEDAPYRHVNLQTDLRLQGLSLVNLDDFSHHFFKAPYVSVFLFDWNFELLSQKITTYTHLKLPISIQVECQISLDDAALSRSRAAKSEYASQGVFNEENTPSERHERYYKL